MGGVGLSLVGFFLVVHSFKISKALTFTISSLGTTTVSSTIKFEGKI
jgi:hypothetical protein